MPGWHSTSCTSSAGGGKSGDRASASAGWILRQSEVSAEACTPDHSSARDLWKHLPQAPVSPPLGPRGSPPSLKVDLKLQDRDFWASLHGQVPGLLDWDMGNECFLSSTTSHLPQSTQKREWGCGEGCMGGNSIEWPGHLWLPMLTISLGSGSGTPLIRGSGPFIGTEPPSPHTLGSQRLSRCPPSTRI